MRPKTAPAAGTPTALLYLESYLDEHEPSNRKLATASLLGCSVRTAARITSRKKNYVAPMKMEWVSNICRATGKPEGDILGTYDPKTRRQVLVGWNRARNAPEALQFAADCAVSIVSEASTKGLHGHFQVTYREGYPREVIISLSPIPALEVIGGKLGLHRIILTSERVSNSPDKKMFIRYVCPVGKSRGALRLTGDRLTLILDTIHAHTKDFPAEIQREIHRSPA